MSGTAYCHACETELDIADDVDEKQPPQQPEPSYHCGFCGSQDIVVTRMG